MRFTLIFLCFAVVLAISHVRCEVSSEESEFEIVQNDDPERMGDVITVDGVAFDISQLSEDDLEQFLQEIEELQQLDPADFPDVDEDISDVSVTSPANCRRACTRMYWPVCARINARAQTFGSQCELDNEMRCADAQRLRGEHEAPIIRLLHEGACKRNELRQRRF